MSKSRTSSERGGLLIVSAPSGGGKTSLTRALVPRLADRGIEAVISVSYTTRPPRPGEQDAVHYHFVEAARFAEMVAREEFLEHADVFGRRYGTGRAATDDLLARGCEVILDIDWQGAQQVRARVAAAAGVFILPPSRAELERRLRARAQDEEQVIGKRMQAARDEMRHHDEYDYLIVNERFETALDELGAIVQASRAGAPERVDRLRSQAQQRLHATLIRELLA